jgi:hypothetical protein
VRTTLKAAEATQPPFLLKAWLNFTFQLSLFVKSERNFWLMLTYPPRAEGHRGTIQTALNQI